MRTRVAVSFIVALTAAPSYAQSLADVARQEEAKRATSTNRAVKSYSNSDLRAGATNLTTAGGSPECYMSIREDRCVSAEQLLQNTNGHVISSAKAKEEQSWRVQADGLRAQLAILQQEIDAMSGVASDQSRSSSERQHASQVVESRRKSVAAIQTRWKRLAKSAEDFRIPRAWLEPAPNFPPQP